MEVKLLVRLSGTAERLHGDESEGAEGRAAATAAVLSKSQSVLKSSPLVAGH